jgi:hypothetical protein
MLNNELAEIFDIRNANLWFTSQPQGKVKNCHRVRTKLDSTTMVCLDGGIIQFENNMKHDFNDILLHCSHCQNQAKSIDSLQEVSN